MRFPEKSLRVEHFGEVRSRAVQDVHAGRAAGPIGGEALLHRPRDLVGYALVYFAVNSMVVLFLMWFFARTFTYVPPAV